MKKFKVTVIIEKEVSRLVTAKNERQAIKKVKDSLLIPRKISSKNIRELYTYSHPISL